MKWGIIVNLIIFIFDQILLKCYLDCSGNINPWLAILRLLSCLCTGEAVQRENKYDGLCHEKIEEVRDAAKRPGNSWLEMFFCCTIS